MSQASLYRSVPELSLKNFIHGTATQKEVFQNDLFKGLKDYGFIILKDHPISEELLSKAYQASERLFALSEETKRTYISKFGGGQRGYTPFGKEHAKDSSVPDLKEFWHVGRELEPSDKYFKDYPANVWPEEVPNFRDIFLEIYQSLDEVGKIMLSALAPSLDVPSDYFDQLIANGNSILRLLHYPPIPDGADPRCIRAAAHEDINLITILVSASASGLQLLTRDNEWLDVETDPNNLIVDAGDMLSRITNEVIPSTTHRVVNPSGENKSRYSMPYFIHPNPDAILTCLKSCKGGGAKYPDISAQDFLMQRLKEIGLS